MAAARAGAAGPAWWTADVQNAGRGRLGRSWSTARGNFAGSLLLTDQLTNGTRAALPLTVGIAVWDAIARLAPACAANGRLRLKWPNDVLIDGAKIAGLLIETSPSAARAGAALVVIGIGVNLGVAPQFSDRTVTSLSNHAGAVAPDILRPILTDRLMTWLAISEAESSRSEQNRPDVPEAIRAAWSHRALPAGTSVTVKTGVEVIAGEVIGLTNNGALRLRLPTGADCEVTFGDVLLQTAKA